MVVGMGASIGVAFILLAEGEDWPLWLRWTVVVAPACLLAAHARDPRAPLPAGRAPGQAIAVGLMLTFVVIMPVAFALAVLVIAAGTAYRLAIDIDPTSPRWWLRTDLFLYLGLVTIMAMVFMRTSRPLVLDTITLRVDRTEVRGGVIALNADAAIVVTCRSDEVESGFIAIRLPPSGTSPSPTSASSCR